MLIDTPILIQARSGSKRFPQKVLTNLKNGHSILWNVYRNCTEVSNNVFVIGIKQDNMLFEHCKKYGIKMMSIDVPENDLIARYVVGLGNIGATGFVRVTADCPYIFPQEILWTAMIALKGQYDFVTNGWPGERTTPDGVDCEYYSRDLLGWMHNNIKPDYIAREHLPLYIYEHFGKDDRLELFRIHKAGWPLDFSGIKFSIDTREDLERVEKGEL